MKTYGVVERLPWGHSPSWIGYDGVRLTFQNCGLYRLIIHPRVIVIWRKV
jgi:hypothetical protein